jgi:hypothetical protein
MLLDSGVLELSQMLELLTVMDIIEKVNLVITFLLLLFFLYYAFCVRRILKDHYQDYLGQNVSISGLAVFFLQVYYLQFKINRLV